VPACVTTQVKCNHELIHDRENGLMMPERDLQNLALSIVRLMNNQNRSDWLGQQVRQTMLAAFDIHQTASQMASILHIFHKQYLEYIFRIRTNL
jgi:hypothetical protein